jgi:hypothetical protein
MHKPAEVPIIIKIIDERNYFQTTFVMILKRISLKMFLLAH